MVVICIKSKVQVQAKSNIKSKRWIQIVMIVLLSIINEVYT